MELRLERYIASMVRYIESKASAEMSYYESIPEDYKVPSLYFQPPRTGSSKETFDSWLTTISMDIWFMSSSNWASYASAADVRDAIIYDNLCIDIMNEDGTETGKKFRVAEPELSPVDTNIVKLTVDLKHYRGWEKEAVKIDNIYLLGVWSSVIRDLSSSESE